MKPLELQKKEDKQGPTTRSRKRISREEVPNYMWPEKVARHSNGQESKESPMCVASMATQFLNDVVPSLKLNSPRNEDAPNHASTQRAKRNPSPHDVDMGACVPYDRFAPLLELRGASLVEALQEARSDDYICYIEGYLEQHVAKQMMKLYDHVCEEWEGLSDALGSTPACPTWPQTRELPQWFPREDDQGGLSRAKRLDVALDFDIWQWYSIAGEDFSLLDSLVWMGVQMQRLFADP